MDYATQFNLKDEEVCCSHKRNASGCVDTVVSLCHHRSFFILFSSLGWGWGRQGGKGRGVGGNLCFVGKIKSFLEASRKSHLTPYWLELGHIPFLLIKGMGFLLDWNFLTLALLAFWIEYFFVVGESCAL